MSNHSENSFTRFLSGKGFYFVLALCLAGAGAAAYLAVETAPDAVTEPEPQPAPITQPGDHEEWTFPQFEEAAGSHGRKGSRRRFLFRGVLLAAALARTAKGVRCFRDAGVLAEIVLDSAD